MQWCWLFAIGSLGCLVSLIKLFDLFFLATVGNLNIFSFEFQQTAVTCLSVWKTVAFPTKWCAPRLTTTSTADRTTPVFTSAALDGTEGRGAPRSVTAASGCRSTSKPRRESRESPPKAGRTQTSGLPATIWLTVETGRGLLRTEKTRGPRWAWVLNPYVSDNVAVLQWQPNYGVACFSPTFSAFTYLIVQSVIDKRVEQSYSYHQPNRLHDQCFMVFMVGDFTHYIHGLY